MSMIIDFQNDGKAARRHDVLCARTGECLNHWNIFYADDVEGVVRVYAKNEAGGFFADKDGTPAQERIRKAIKIVAKPAAELRVIDEGELATRAKRAAPSAPKVSGRLSMFDLIESLGDQAVANAGRFAHDLLADSLYATGPVLVGRAIWRSERKGEVAVDYHRVEPLCRRVVDGYVSHDLELAPTTEELSAMWGIPRACDVESPGVAARN